MTTSMDDKRTAHRLRMDCPGVRVTEVLEDRIGGRAVAWPRPRQSMDGVEDDPEPTIERGRE